VGKKRGESPKGEGLHAKGFSSIRVRSFWSSLLERIVPGEWPAEAAANGKGKSFKKKVSCWGVQFGQPRIRIEPVGKTHRWRKGFEQERTVQGGGEEGFI